MNVEQSPMMSEEMMEKLRELYGEPTAFDPFRALWYAKEETDITPVRQIAKETNRVTSVSLHKPGEIVEMSDGRKYEVQDNGQWLRVDKP